MSTAPTTVLAIESSCDETCAAVVHGREVLSSIVASQTDLHDAYGGVVPEIASRRHLELVDAVVDRSLAEAGVARPDVVAATQGPGLIGALLVGLANAKARAWAWDVPLRVVDHLSGHVASALIADPALEPPFLCLLASGGHTLLVEVGEGLALRVLGGSRDDAAGEAFDKGARLLGLPMPGGPAIEHAAAGGDPARIPITPAMLHHDGYDTSFAGIKTALAVAVQRDGIRELDGGAGAPTVSDAAAALQQAIVATIAGCVRKALRDLAPSTLALVGGVAANTALRAELSALCGDAGVEIVTVPLRYCADNAAMIGAAAAYVSDLKPETAHIVDAYATSPLSSSGVYVPT